MVHTDVVQSVVMLVGVLAIVVQASLRVGGLNKAWNIAAEHGRIEFFKWVHSQTLHQRYRAIASTMCNVETDK